VPKDLVKIFDNRELELLISGLQVIDIDDLRENTLYQDYTAHSKPIKYLFEVLYEFDNMERAEFLRFVTGSSKVPVEGFRGLRAGNGVQKFTVVRIPTSTQ
jgi:E3 ubiquitin-protein ligase HUWE1